MITPMRRALLLILALPLFAACSSSTSPTPKSSSSSQQQRVVSVDGRVQLTEDMLRGGDPAGSDCWASGNSPVFATPGPLDDVKAGAQVVVTDGMGRTVGVGVLSDGHTTGPSTDAVRAPCEFVFSVPNITVGSGFYAFKVGEHSKQVPAAGLASPVLSFP